jgi:hypothetical protein
MIGTGEKIILNSAKSLETTWHPRKEKKVRKNNYHVVPGEASKKQPRTGPVGGTLEVAVNQKRIKKKKARTNPRSRDPQGQNRGGNLDRRKGKRKGKRQKKKKEKKGKTRKKKGKKRKKNHVQIRPVGMALGGRIEEVLEE